MNIDVGFWLSIAVLVCLVVWILDRLLKITKKPEHALKEPVEFIISLLPVFFVVLVIRSFIVEPFNIPSGSMIPTLHVNDFILVDKFAYGLRLPVFNTKILNTGEPHRGDVMVFRYPRNPSEHFIKRVVGLPGDHISMRSGQLYVNGKEVPHTPLRHWVEGGVYHLVEVETLGHKKHLIQRLEPIDPYTGKPELRYQDGEWVVPPGHYFVMGDNRDNSNDSRFWGTVPEDLVEGRAFLIWLHTENHFPWVTFSRDGHLDKPETLK